MSENDRVKNCETVARYVIMELVKMGYRIQVNRSSQSSDSWYIKIFVDKQPGSQTVHLRISDHDVGPKYRMTVFFDYDVYVNWPRREAITFMDFMVIFTDQYREKIPQDLADLLSATGYFAFFTG